MKEVLLDTNFILTCVRQKIDFFEDIRMMGMSIIIPRQILRELEKISVKDDSPQFRDEARLSLGIIGRNRFRKIGLDGKTVDDGIIKIARANAYLVIATLDKRIKNLINNPKLIIRNERKLALE
jgi:rRNA-processing protein FCF1